MGEKINDGGPAFPRSANDCDNGAPGMSLRDWFAGMAMQGSLSGRECALDAQMVGMASYAFADAMLKAREAENGNH